MYRVGVVGSDCYPVQVQISAVQGQVQVQLGGITQYTKSVCLT